MQWPQALDAWLFHLVNPALSNPFFDVVMPFLSGNAFFAPALLVGAIWLLWRGGARGRIFVVMVLLAVALGDGFVLNTLKHAIQRPRPFWTLNDVRLPPGIGRTDSGSMPSSHAANWFAATMVAFIYYRRSIRFMLPMAVLVGFSRIYNGVHYPSDVLAGAILGAGYAACGVWTLDALWKWAGRRWFPLWWERLPSLLNPIVVPRATPADPKMLDAHLLRFGYVLIFALFAVNLAYLAAGKITLSEDEAYQWIWSKHLALSYYSKPPFIALTQFLGTHLWGDTAFGVRFFSPVLATLTALAVIRFMSRVANVRVAFWLSIIMPLTPLLSLGSILMTIDPLSVMFWILATIAGWRAAQDNSTTRDWLWVGLWMGCGFLSKYVSLFQLLSWAVFFALWPPARKQLRRPGPYLALLVNLLCALPVIIWNQQNHWITFKHVTESVHIEGLASAHSDPFFKDFPKFLVEFIGEEIGLQNPFFFLPAVWAIVVFWRRKNNSALERYFFSMGAPLLLTCFVLTFHARSLPNWIAPSIVPLFCLAAVYWEERWREGFRPIKTWLILGVIYGCFAAVVLRDTSLITRLVPNPIPLVSAARNAKIWAWWASADSTRRVKGWAETAQTVEAARQKLQAEGKPAFIIGGHYGITGELTFNLPEARAGLPDHPLVYFLSSPVPLNQFYFWPGYHDRKGENAIYVPTELDLLGTNTPPIPDVLEQEFESVTNLGSVTVMSSGVPMHRIQIVECRGLR